MIKYLTVPYMLMHGLKNLKVFKVLGQTAAVKQAIAKQVPRGQWRQKRNKWQSIVANFECIHWRQ